MRRGSLLAILALGVLVPSSGRAAEATIAVEGSAQYDTNVFSTPTNLIDDVSFRPAVEVGLKADPSSDFQWSLMYRPDYQAYVSTHGINGFDHLAQANLDYHLSGATDVYLKEQFQHVLNLIDRTQFLASDPTGLGQPSLIFGRQAVTLNDLQTGVTHNFSPRLQGVINLSNSLYYPQAKNVSDASTSGITGDLIYALSPRDRIGPSLGFTYQQLSATDVQPRTSTLYYQLMGIWIHDFSPTFQLDMRAGPAWVDPSTLNLNPQPQSVPPVPLVRLGTGNLSPFDARTCPTKGGNLLLTNECKTLSPLTDAEQNALAGAPNVTINPIPGDTGGTNGGLTYFAAITLTKHWERWDASLNYTRDSGTSSSFNQSTILDTVQGGLLWHPGELWNVSLNASWSRRTSASDQPVLVPVVEAAGVGNPFGIDPNAAVYSAFTTVKFSNAIDVDNYVAYIRVDRKLSRRLSTFGLFLYDQQKVNGGFVSGNDFTDYRVQFGVRYEFEPLPLAL